jgi:hypothetical protein
MAQADYANDIAIKIKKQELGEGDEGKNMFQQIDTSLLSLSD